MFHGSECLEFIFDREVARRLLVDVVKVIMMIRRPDVAPAEGSEDDMGTRCCLLHLLVRVVIIIGRIVFLIRVAQWWWTILSSRSTAIFLEFDFKRIFHVFEDWLQNYLELRNVFDDVFIDKL